MSTNWRFLVVEDQAAIADELLEAIPRFVDPPDTAEGELCRTFPEAAGRLKSVLYDVLILDLKDDSSDWHLTEDEPAGIKIFDELKKTRFVPVVFYTALAHKVRSEQTSFVRVVEKTETIDRVKEEVRRVLATQLPALTRQIEEIQRSYMWDFVSANWRQFDTAREKGDLAYLLARRLALSFQRKAKTMALRVSGEASLVDEQETIHPMQMYVYPPLGGRRSAGDILHGTIGSDEGHWLILTPSCDFEQRGRLTRVIVAMCKPLAGHVEYCTWQQSNQADSEALKCLIGDNRKKTQPERFKFLPGTFFLPDLVVDFQELRAVPHGDVERLKAVASLDSPFAEAVSARFARYYGRLGTPDLDKDVVIGRLGAESLGRSG
jgi:CheY-like chemotaxis protein